MFPFISTIGLYDPLSLCEAGWGVCGDWFAQRPDDWHDRVVVSPGLHESVKVNPGYPFMARSVDGLGCGFFMATAARLQAQFNFIRTNTALNQFIDDNLRAMLSQRHIVSMASESIRFAYHNDGRTAMLVSLHDLIIDGNLIVMDFSTGKIKVENKCARFGFGSLDKVVAHFRCFYAVVDKVEASNGGLINVIWMGLITTVACIN